MVLVRPIFACLPLCLFLFTSHPAYSFFSGWHEHQEPVLYGKDRDKKVPIRAIVFKLEKWENHFAWEAFFLIHYTNYPKYTSFTVFPLVHHKSSKIRDQSRFQFINFLTSHTPQDSMFTLLPFYYQKKTLREKSFQNTSLLHYYYTSKKETTWLSPVFYYHVDDAEIAYAAPLFYHNKQKDQKSILIGPFWRSHSKKAYSFHIIPLYWYWESEQDKTQAWFPFFVNYYSPDKIFHGNILGFFWQNNYGSFITLSENTQRASDNHLKTNNTEYWYLETEFSWFYNFFSIANRMPEKNQRLIKSLTSEKKPAQMQAETNKDKYNAYEYNSIQFLFGLYAWEKIDDRRNFRAIPLAWLSWSKKDDDHFAATPLFFLYSDSKIRYFSTLPVPVYGYMKEEDYSFYAYGILAYWYEHVPSINYSERSILWPLVNWYHGPNIHGARVLPFYYQNKSPSKEISYIMGYYHSESKDMNYRNFATIVSKYNSKNGDFTQWCFFLCLISTESASYGKSFSLGYSILGDLTLQKDFYSMQFGLLFWQGSSGQKGNKKFYSGLLPFYFYQTSHYKTYLFVFPLLSYYQRTYGNYANGTDIWGLGILYYKSTGVKFNTSEYWLLGILYQYKNRRARNYTSHGSLWNILWQSEVEKEWNKFSILKFVFSVTNDKNNRVVRFLGIPVYETN